MKFKMSIAISVLLVATGCGNKGTSVDPGPKFTVSYQSQGLDSNSPLHLQLERAFTSPGPQLEVVAEKPAEISSINKRLECGPMAIDSKLVSTGDLSAYNFSMSPGEFPRIEILPMRTPCKLIVKVTNKIGSTSTKIFPVELKFDSHPLKVDRAISYVGVNLIDWANRSVTLELYKIRNTLPYAIGFTYHPVRTATMWGQYLEDAAPHYLHGYSKNPTAALNTKIVINPTVTNVYGSPDSEVAVRLNPGDEIQISSTFQIPTSVLNPGVGGIHLNQIVFSDSLVPAASPVTLYQWQGFDHATIDESEPAGVSIDVNGLTQSPLSYQADGFLDPRLRNVP